MTLNESEVVEPAAGELREATPLPKVHVVVPEVLLAKSVAFTRSTFAPTGFSATLASLAVGLSAFQGASFSW
ncbi:hypothetical protein D3C74_397300 [compost metagenome]